MQLLPLFRQDASAVSAHMDLIFYESG